MKFNFRKIASVLASAVMIGSTVGIAAAANYPAPFIAGGSADVAVVVGSTAAASDFLAAADLGANLQAELAKQTATTGTIDSASTVSGGDFVKLAKSTDLFNLGDSMDDFYSSLDSDELTTVLADGVYTNDENDDFDFDQKIELGALQLTHFQNADFNDEKPVIGFDLVDGDHVLNYTLDFSPDSAEGGTAFVSFETTDIEMLGRAYYIVDASGSANGVKLSLLDSANSAIISEGETSTITVGEESYEVSISYINDNDEVILVINGVTTNKLAEGDVFKVATDVYVAVKNNLYEPKESGISKAEISIGSGKIVLENGQEVEVNNEDVSDIEEYNDAELKAYITNSSTNIDKIVLQWNLGDDTWIASDSELVLPGFETIKLTMAGFTMPKQEVTKLVNDGTGEDSKAKLETYVEDGKISFNILYGNSSGGFGGLGKDADDLLITGTASSIVFNMNTDERFVASWILGDDAESYLLTVTDIDHSDPAKNVTTIESQADGSTKKLTLDIGESDSLNNIKFTLNAASETAKTANISIAGVSGGTASFNKIYTKDGLKIQLPWRYNSANYTADGAGGDGAFQTNASAPGYAGNTNWVMNFTEETKDGNINSGESFTATWGFNSDDEVQISSVSVDDFETEDGSDKYVGYVESDLATQTLFATGSDQDTVDITYAGEESYADVYVSESGAVVEAAAVSTGTGTVTELGSVTVKDTEVSLVQSKNLVVVGGSCINSVAAKVLEGALCGAAFTTKTGIGADQALLKVVKNPYLAADTTKIAMLVAGYEAADTSKAVKYLTTSKPSTAVGEIKLSTSGSVATVATTA